MQKRLVGIKPFSRNIMCLNYTRDFPSPNDILFVSDIFLNLYSHLRWLCVPESSKKYYTFFVVVSTLPGVSEEAGGRLRNYFSRL